MTKAAGPRELFGPAFAEYGYAYVNEVRVEPAPEQLFGELCVIYDAAADRREFTDDEISALTTLFETAAQEDRPVALFFRGRDLSGTGGLWRSTVNGSVLGGRRGGWRQLGLEALSYLVLTTTLVYLSSQQTWTGSTRTTCRDRRLALDRSRRNKVFGPGTSQPSSVLLGTRPGDSVSTSESAVSRLDTSVRNGLADTADGLRTRLSPAARAAAHLRHREEVVLRVAADLDQGHVGEPGRLSNSQYGGPTIASTSGPHGIESATSSGRTNFGWAPANPAVPGSSAFTFQPPPNQPELLVRALDGPGRGRGPRELGLWPILRLSKEAAAGGVGGGGGDEW